MSMREMQHTFFELKAVKVQDKVVSNQNDGQMKDFTEHYGISKVCVPTRNLLEDDGSIEEEKAKQKEQTEEEAVAKQEPTKPDHNWRTKTKREHKRQRKLVKNINGNTPLRTEIS